MLFGSWKTLGFNGVVHGFQVAARVVENWGLI